MNSSIQNQITEDRGWIDCKIDKKIVEEFDKEVTDFCLEQLQGADEFGNIIYDKQRILWFIQYKLKQSQQKKYDRGFTDGAVYVINHIRIGLKEWIKDFEPSIYTKLDIWEHIQIYVTDLLKRILSRTNET